MKAVVLAAGRGSRLAPLTDDRPKCLLELAGMTLIGRQLAVLRGAGIAEITVATGYRAEALRLPGVTTVHNARWNTTNMVETLFCAAAGFGDDLVVSYGDIVFEPRVLAALLASPHPVSVVIDRAWRALWEMRFADPLGDAETLRLHADGTIAEIGQPPRSLDDIEGQYIGLMRFRGSGVEALRRTKALLGSVPRPWMARRPVEKAYMTDLLMEMVLRGHPVHAVPVAGGWLEIDTRADYEKAAAMVADGTIGRFFDPAAAAEA